MTPDPRIEFLMQSAASHDRQIGELTENLAKLAEKVDQVTGTVDQLTGTVDQLTGKIDQITDAVAALVRVTNDDATAIRTLARIAESYDARISALERSL